MFPGWVYDMTGDFNNSFYLGTVAGCLASLLAVITYLRMRCTSPPPLPEGHGDIEDVVKVAHCDDIMDRDVAESLMGSQILS